MTKIQRAVKRIAENPRRNFSSYMDASGLLNGLTDKQYIKLMFWAFTGRKIDLKNPRGFCEKIQWLKLYDHNPLYRVMADKYLAKSYVGNIIGEEHIIPLLGVWDSPEEIDFDHLPDKFVLKCNHNSGEGMCICTDKTSLDIAAVKKELSHGLKRDYFFRGRQWSYKGIPRKIIAEQFIEDDLVNNIVQGGIGLIDYKFYCFGGIPKFLYVGYANFINGQKNDLLSYRNLDWTPAPFYRTDHPPFPIEIKAPDCLDEMIVIAKKLSNGIPFVRVDLYYANQRVLFSEMTFYPGGGMNMFLPEEWEIKLGDLIPLPEKRK